MGGPRSYKPQTGVRFTLLRQWLLGLLVDDATLSRWKDESDSRRSRNFLAWRNVTRLLYKRRIGSSSLSARMMSPSRLELGSAS